MSARACFDRPGQAPAFAAHPRSGVSGEQAFVVPVWEPRSLQAFVPPAPVAVRDRSAAVVPASAEQGHGVVRAAPQETEAYSTEPPAGRDAAAWLPPPKPETIDKIPA